MCWLRSIFWAFDRLGVELLAVNFVSSLANLILGVFPLGLLNLYLCTGRSFSMAMTISLLGRFGLGGWGGARMMRLSPLTGLLGLGGVEDSLSMGDLFDLGLTLGLIELSGLWCHPRDLAELPELFSTTQMSLVALAALSELASIGVLLGSLFLLILPNVRSTYYRLRFSLCLFLMIYKGILK